MERKELNHGVTIPGWALSSHEWMLRILLVLVLMGIFGTLRPPAAQASTQPLTLSGNGRYLVQGSTPFFWLGDTGWMLFSNASLAGSPYSEVDQYLQDRKNRGFTVIQSFLVHWQPMTPNRQGHVPFFNNDLGQPNPAYFDDVETIIDKAAALGLQMAIGPAALGGALPYFDDGAAHVYGSYLAWRFRFKTNIIWMLCGDRDPNIALSGVRAMAEGIRTSDFTHLITCHPPGFSSSRQLIPGEAWQNFSMVQLGPGILAETYELIKSDYNLWPPQPTGNGEPWYELYLGATAYDMRRSAYWSFMAGGAYYTYGNHWIWGFDPGWQAGLGTLGGVQLATYYRGLLTERQWWKYEPDQSVIASGAGSGLTLNTAVRSTDGDSILVYLSNSASNVAINLYRFTAGSTVQARWYNPTNGQYTTIGAYPNSGTQWFATPGGWQDAVLVLETAGASSPASLTAAPASVGPGGAVTVNWTGASSPTDWIGRFSPGEGDGSYGDWKYTSTCAQSAGGSVSPSGWCTFTMPGAAGAYEFRLFANGSYSRLAISNNVTVTGGGGGGGPANLVASPSSVGPGGAVTVSWTGSSSPRDWISGSFGGGGLFAWLYTSTCTQSPGGSVVSSGSCSFTMPSTAGTYLFQLLANDGFNLLATSGPVEVSGAGGGNPGPPNLTVNPAATGPGGTVTASWNGGSSATDWIGCYSTSGASACDWIYTSSCTQNPGGSAVASGSCTFTMPFGLGAYEFRFYSAGGFDVLARSPIVIVQ